MADDHRMFIAGEWVGSESGVTFEATSPSTGEVIGTLPEGTRDDVRRAVVAAAEAFGIWSRFTAFDRAGAMRRVAEAIDGRRDEMARTLALDKGKPLRAEAFDEVEELIVYFDMAAADAVRVEGLIPPSVVEGNRVFVYRVPRGVAGVISPWNWPYTMPGEIVAPALASGNTVVLAPASTTSVCAVALAEVIAEADLPPGTYNLVTGPGAVVGDEVASNGGVATVGFIGSIATGHRVAERAAGKELLLEMGGNGPLVLLEDADLDAAVEATLSACFLNADRPARPANASWCRRPCTTTTSTALPPRSPSGSIWATRSTTRRRWARSTTRPWPTRPSVTSATPRSSARRSLPAASGRRSSAAICSSRPRWSTA